MTRLAVRGMRLRICVMSLEAWSLARSSAARPSSTNARSITGSSKNVGQPRAGTPSATALIEKLARAPRVTREFMFGRPRHRLWTPSTSVSRPGPANATIDRTACALAPHSACNQCGTTKAEPPGRSDGRRCTAWPTTHAPASTHAAASRRPLSRSRSRRASRRRAASASADAVELRTLASKPASSMDETNELAASVDAALCSVTIAVSVVKLTFADSTSGCASSKR
mmetsp:Transcript_22231/g.72052  ORF Transcript_22231/g.72052 Transcript_22231/m.72052 type:complete len:227 (+) Transcript_22231:2033-2713(+)